MARYSFDTSLLTGNDQVDDQHRSLFELISDLSDALEKGEDRALQTQTLQKLTRYTVGHFATEESLMRSVSYPGLAKHHAKHVELADKVRNLLVEFQESYENLTVELADFLAKWLRHHIHEEDRALADWLKTNPSTTSGSQND